MSRRPLPILLLCGVLCAVAAKGEPARFSEVPLPPAAAAAPSAAAEDPVELLAQGLKTEPVSFAAVSQPLGAFVDQVMSTLGVPYVPGPGIRERPDPVTLRLAAPMPPAQLFRITRQILRGAGIGMRLQSGVLLLSADTAAATARAAFSADGTVPAASAEGQPVIVAVPLRSVRYTAVTPWLSQAFGGAGLQADQEPSANMLLLSGPPTVVAEALRAVGILDRPKARAARTMLLRPRFAALDDLSAGLLDVLRSEGIDADNPALEASLVVLPLKSTRALAVFAADQALLDHAAEWVRVLDQKAGADARAAMFSYPLRFAVAEEVVESLNGLRPRPTAGKASPATSEQEPSAAAAPETPSPESDAQTTVPARPAAPRAEPGGRLAVDPNRNAVVFRGASADWRILYPRIRDMDVPAIQVDVEMLLVEVTLDDRFSSGLEWLASGSLRGKDLSYGTVGGLGLGDQGFNLSLRDDATVRGVLNLFGSDGRVRIRARPRLVVASGHRARLDVGNAVPVVSASSRSTGSGRAPLITSVEYRNTGLSLEILPVARQGGQLDIEVAQSLSEAERNTSSSIDSPIIRTRHLSTTVSLRDGGAVLLGGLSSEEQADAGSGVSSTLGALPPPARSRSSTRMELMLLIRPRLHGENAPRPTVP